MSRPPKAPPKGAPPARDFYAVAGADRLKDVCGPTDANLMALEQALSRYSLRADNSGGGVALSGEAEGVALAMLALARFEARIAEGRSADPDDMKRSVSDAVRNAAPGVALRGLKVPVTGETEGQKRYLEALTRTGNGLVFGAGPAGTGKTYLAVAVGLSELLSRARERLIIARPAVEAGERIGFLPGTFEEKVDPYLMPIWDSLRELAGQEALDSLKRRGAIEVAPLAFMRGRTLKNAFVIVDEAQNATIAQMKMVLTRLGRGSRMAVTGDPSQVDLPDRSPSGLAHAIGILNAVPGVEVCRLTGEDVVRHDLVGRIIERYDADAARQMKRPPTPPAEAVEAEGEATLDFELRIDDPRWDEEIAGLDGLIADTLAAIARRTGAEGEVSLALMNDAAIRLLNRDFRGKDKATDVLSFPPGPPSAKAPEHAFHQDAFLGDVAISLETARKDAAKGARALEDHVRHLLTHGILHLLGYDHEADDEAAEMEALEALILSDFGLADPYTVEEQD